MQSASASTFQHCIVTKTKPSDQILNALHWQKLSETHRRQIDSNKSYELYFKNFIQH